jgi:uncharacterized protein (UPF0332 family)
VNAAEFLGKAQRAIASARLLLDSGDIDGACNRAYYAIFDAARAALLATGEAIALEAPKSHNGLIAAFSQRLVKTGRVPIELGKAFNRVADIRLVADYAGPGIDAETARWAVAAAEKFVTAMRSEFPIGAEGTEYDGNDRKA